MTFNYALHVLDQAKLTQPAKVPGEAPAARRERNHIVRLDMLLELKSLPLVETPVMGSADWAANPNVLHLRIDKDTWGAPTFQFDEAGKPLELVTSVNAWLAQRYRYYERPMWSDERISRLIWWFIDHASLGHPPIKLLGTDRQAELVTLATPEALRR